MKAYLSFLAIQYEAKAKAFPLTLIYFNLIRTVYYIMDKIITNFKYLSVVLSVVLNRPCFPIQSPPTSV